MSRFNYSNQKRPAGGAGRGIFTNLVDPDPNNPYAKSFKVGRRAKVMGENLRIQQYPFIAPNVVEINGGFMTIEEGGEQMKVMIMIEGDKEFANITQDGAGSRKTFKLLPLKAKSL